MQQSEPVRPSSRTCILRETRRTNRKPPILPSKDELVAFIGTQPGKVGTREIARAFGLKNADRAALKRMLRELADEGVVERRRKKLHHAGTLPHVVVADITARDRDGELIAVPTEWDEEAHGDAAEDPHPCRRARRGPAKSPASATARCCASRRPATTATPSATPAASSRSSTAPSSACSASSARCRTAAAGWSPIDKKQLGRELDDPAGRRPATRRTATSSRSSVDARTAASACRPRA